MPNIFLQSDEYERKKQEEDELLKECVIMFLENISVRLMHKKFKIMKNSRKIHH